MSFAYLAATPGLKHNYSLYAIPTGWVLGMAPLWWAVGAAGKHYDNVNPREGWAKLDESSGIESSVRRIKRAVAANQNNEVNLALFAASLAVANAARLPSRFLHICAGTYLTARSAYNLLYVLVEDPNTSWLRTISYWTGVGSWFALAIKSAQHYKALPL